MTTTVSYQFATVPPLPPRHVSRPRLLAALDRAADAPITLLCAGPGAGKTVLLAEWVKNLKAPGHLGHAGTGRRRARALLAPA